MIDNISFKSEKNNVILNIFFWLAVDESTRPLVSSENGINVLKRILQGEDTNIDAKHIIVTTLSWIAHTVKNHPYIVQDNGVVLLISLLDTKYTDDVRLAALNTISWICRDATGCRVFEDADGISTLLSLLRGDTSCEFLGQGLEAISYIAQNDGGRLSIINDSGLSVIMSAIDNTRCTDNLKKIAVNALNSFSMDPATANRVLTGKGKLRLENLAKKDDHNLSKLAKQVLSEFEKTSQQDQFHKSLVTGGVIVVATIVIRWLRKRSE